MVCIASRELSYVSHTKRPLPSPCVYGGVAGRRREEDVGAALNIHASKSYLFKLRRCPRSFTNVTRKSVMQHLEVEEKTEEARGGHSSQSAHQHDIENTWRRGLGNYKMYEAGRFGVRHLPWGLRHTAQEVCMFSSR